jgi:hypothetical protein
VSVLVGIDLIPRRATQHCATAPGPTPSTWSATSASPGWLPAWWREHGLNALACAGGLSHIPVEAFAGWSAFAPGTWLVATTAEDPGDAAGGPYGRYLAGEVREGGSKSCTASASYTAGG